MTRAERPHVVFLSYNGLLDPLGRSQILAYLERLNREWPVHVMSFEKKDKLADTQALRSMQTRLADQDLGWIQLRYHQKPSLPATTYDMLSGVIALRRLMAKHQVGLLHARGYVPMEIATNSTRRTPIIFDIRGLQAEEYVDGGSWKEGELKWRLAKRSERRFFRRANGAVVLTEAIKPYVSSRFAEVGNDPVLDVIPCCVDLDRFSFREEARKRMRAKLGVDDDTTVFVYSGSLGSWYLPDVMAKLVRAYRDQSKKKVFLLWTVNNLEELAREATANAGLSSAEHRIQFTPADELVDVLCAADVGLALIKPCFSKKSSSPTKYAEYLSLGLPIVIMRDVGDGAVLERDGGAVALGSEADINDALPQIDALLAKPRSFYRELAERHFDVDRVAIPSYRSLYTKLIKAS